MKKLTISTLILLLLSVSVSVFGVKSQDGLWECAFNDEMEAEILAYHGTEAEIAIPEFVDGYQVIAIGDEAFRGRYDLTAITLPESIMVIGNRAFRNCSSLASINLPENIFSIGEWAFTSCLNLTSVVIPPYVTEISSGTFFNCTNLTSITLHEEITTIKFDAFAQCASLTQITLPESIATIENGAFYGCSGLKQIILPKGITSLGGIFSGCTSLTSIEIPEGITSVEMLTFEGCTSLTEVILPDSITSIGEMAFWNCSSLTKITLPESIEKIGEGAFMGCTSLVSIDIPMYVTSIGMAAFYDCPTLTNINIAEENQNYVNVDGILFDIDKTMLLCYPSQREGEAYTVPDSVKHIFPGAFHKCYYLTEVTIPNSVEFMDINFKACENLTAINVLAGNKNYTDIDGVLFNKNKTRLIAYPGGKEGAYIIPSSVTVVESQSFWGCSKLTSVTFPKGIGNIRGVFEDCPLLESVTLSESITAVGSYSFQNCPSLTELTITDNITYIDSNAFSGDNNLKSINVSDKNRVYTSIDGVLFTKNKKEIVIYPNKKAGEYAIPDGVKKIGGYAFYECTELTAIEIPSSVTSIEGRIFEGCTELTSVIIPDSVTEMGSRTFAYCEKLKFVYIPESVTKIGYGMLLGSNDAIIITPKGSFAEEYAKKNNFRFSNELVD